MKSNKETVENFNQQLDELVQKKPSHAEIQDENTTLWALGDALRDADFSNESQIRYRLRQRLMNELTSQGPVPDASHSWPRLSLTWLVAMLTVIIAVTILMSVNSKEPLPSASFIRQPQDTATSEPALLTVTPMVRDFNATQTALPPRTPLPILLSSDAITLYYIGHFPLNRYQVVVIASKDIPADTVLEADMLAEVLMPIEVAPAWGYPSVELVVGARAEEDISQWSPIADTRLEFEPMQIDSNYVAVAIPPTAPIINELKVLEEGQHFAITGTFRFIDLDETFQANPEIATLVAPLSEVDGEPQVVTQEFISDAVIVSNWYQHDPESCNAGQVTVNAGADEEVSVVPLVSPARYPCLITIAMSAQDAVAFTWALDSEIPLTITVADSED